MVMRVAREPASFVKRHAAMLIRCFAIHNKLAMRKPLLLLIVVALAAGHGMLTLLGALFLDDVSLLLHVSSILAGGLLVAGAGSLLAARGWAVAMFWISALVYFLSIVWPAFNQHGTMTFSLLMAAFYWSLGVRVFLAVAAHVAEDPEEGRVVVAVAVRQPDEGAAQEHVALDEPVHLGPAS